MNYAIIGGDARMAYLAKLMKSRGDRVQCLERSEELSEPEVFRALKGVDGAILNWPPRLRGTVAWETLRDALPERAKIYCCGPRHPEVVDERIVDLWTDEQLLRDNAWLTAEGAVSAAMRASATAMRGLRAMVIGWGRIGAALTELLTGIGAKVTVASRSETGRHRAIERGAEAVDTEKIEKALPNQKLVFNTAPAMVLNAERMKDVDRDAMMIDLASMPYGIDLRAAWQNGLRAWREPGVPGRYCPESAAEAMLRALERAEKEAKAHD